MKLIIQRKDKSIERGNDKAGGKRTPAFAQVERVFMVDSAGCWAFDEVAGQWYRDGKPVAEAEVPAELTLADGRKLKTKKGGRKNWQLW